MICNCKDIWLNRNGNRIHATARIHPDVVMGEGNVIHAGVVIGGYKDHSPYITIGDNNVIHENVRILCQEFHMDDRCKLHNHVFVDGHFVELRSNVWVGQYSHIDGYARVEILSGVTIGYNCYIWTHAERAGIEAMHSPQRVVLGPNVWLIGANVVVNPGVYMRSGSRALSNSVITKDTKPNCTYGGVPAKEISCVS